MAAISDFFNSESLDAFGFHADFISNSDAQRRIKREQGYFTHNLNNLAGYIPLLGMVGGVRHIVNGNGDFNATTARGCAEIAFCGPIFFVIDILITLGRLLGKALLFCSDKMKSKNELSVPEMGSQPVQRGSSQEGISSSPASERSGSDHNPSRSLTGFGETEFVRI